VEGGRSRDIKPTPYEGEMKVFGIPFGLEFEFVELGTNKKTNVQNAISCLQRLIEYQARLIFAAELLTEWDEPAAAERFHKEEKMAYEICQDVYWKMRATMIAKGMKDAQIERYCKEQFGWGGPREPSDSMIYGRLRKGDIAARTIADRTLDAWER
jgi:hypothetical protein